MPDETLPPERDGAGTAPADELDVVGRSASSDDVPTDDAVGRASLPDDVEPRTFTQEDVDRIVTERLRRERQRAEKAVRDEFAGRIAELEGAQEEAQQARNEAATLSGALKSAESRALIAERLLAKGAALPPPYLALVKGDDVESIDAAIEYAKEQWAEDTRRFGRPTVDVGAPTHRPTSVATRATRVDADLAERMRRGEAEAFREYRTMRQ
jgi:hypothetical protein